jgi:GH25 family lysozyme M1 (1,4-beta-N-acetylmuramidase)
MKKMYVDISEHNTVSSLKNVDGVMIRAGWGYGKPDAKVDKHVKLAEQAGVPYGFYWYGYAQTEAKAKEEAKYCLNVIKKYKSTLPIAYDLEDGDGWKASHGGVPSKKVNTAIVKAFCEALEEAGYYAMYYVNYDWWANKVYHTQLEQYALWLAWWDRTDKPNIAPNEYMHQYTSKGKVSGISGNVDKNYCYVDFVSAIKENGLNGYKAETAKIKVGDEVKVTNPINYDNEKKFKLYYKTYDVIQVDGNRVVIGIGDTVTSAIDIKYLVKV